MTFGRTLCCPCCGTGAPPCPEDSVSCCVQRVRRSVAWFGRMVREADTGGVEPTRREAPMLYRESQPCGCWKDIRAFNRCAAHVAPGEAAGAVALGPITYINPVDRVCARCGENWLQHYQGAICGGFAAVQAWREGDPPLPTFQEAKRADPT